MARAAICLRLSHASRRASALGEKLRKRSSTYPAVGDNHGKLWISPDRCGNLEKPNTKTKGCRMGLPPIMLVGEVMAHLGYDRYRLLAEWPAGGN